jgi:hypothetical protein
MPDMAAQEGPAETGLGNDIRFDNKRSLVVYESRQPGPGRSGSRARMAIPLSAVERIERVPLGSIEYANGDAVLQYDGEVLPLEDDDAVLSGMEVTAGAMATVLICLRPGVSPARRVGLVVERVLEISAGALPDAREAPSDDHLAMVDHRVVTLHRRFLGRLDGAATGRLQEVA